ncbi:MAG TPA: NfeD family protein, partial [Allosphingosinicella sp.]|nr:NfeD family protein [Allosphingosinicella sp.]
MSFFETLAAHWWWLLGAALLGILEIFLPGIFLVWIAAAAGVTGVIVAISGIAFPYQLGIFA